MHSFIIEIAPVHPELVETNLLGTLRILATIIKTDLEGAVSILVIRLNLENGARAGLENRHRYPFAILGEDLGHPHLLTKERFSCLSAEGGHSFCSSR